MSSFTGTSSGTSALRVPPDGSTKVTGTSDIFDSFLNWKRHLLSAKPVCATRNKSNDCVGATRQAGADASTILTGRPYIPYRLLYVNLWLLFLHKLDLWLFLDRFARA